MTPGKTNGWLWLGAGSNEQEHDLGRKLLKESCQCAESECFKEGEETAAFWEAIGGQQEYSKTKQSNVIPGFEPRLFNVSNATGYMTVKEMPAYTQEDLLNDDVYILDCYSTIFVWVGRRAAKQEVNAAHLNAISYIENARDSRDKSDV